MPPSGAPAGAPATPAAASRPRRLSAPRLPAGCRQPAAGALSPHTKTRTSTLSRTARPFPNAPAPTAHSAIPLQQLHQPKTLPTVKNQRLINAFKVSTPSKDARPARNLRAKNAVRSAPRQTNEQPPLTSESAKANVMLTLPSGPEKRARRHTSAIADGWRTRHRHGHETLTQAPACTLLRAVRILRPRSNAAPSWRVTATRTAPGTQARARRVAPALSRRVGSPCRPVVRVVRRGARFVSVARPRLSAWRALCALCPHPPRRGVRVVSRQDTLSHWLRDTPCSLRRLADARPLRVGV